MKHVVQFSTGAGSAEVALRVYDRYHHSRDDDIVLVTADTGVEDDDNWRYARQIAHLMPDAEWVIITHGRTPMEVGRDVRVVPNNRMAVCSRILKRERIRTYMDRTFDPDYTTVYLGFDWTEDHRLEASVGPWHPYKIEAPLMWEPWLTKSQIIDRHRELGIEPCRLYAAGFSHANCGGACVRGGQTEWRRLLYWNRDRYLEWEGEEEQTRTMLGKNVTILRDRSDDDSVPVSLRQFRERIEINPSLFDSEDVGACGCDPWVTA